MDVAEGLRIISVAKSLEGFQRRDQNISSFSGATSLAGHAGLFLSSLRKPRKMKWKKFRTVANSAHIDSPSLDNTVVPWVQKGGFIEITKVGDDNADVNCNVVEYNAILAATSR